MFLLFNGGFGMKHPKEVKGLGWLCVVIVEFRIQLKYDVIIPLSVIYSLDTTPDFN